MTGLLSSLGIILVIAGVFACCYYRRMSLGHARRAPYRVVDAGGKPVIGVAHPIYASDNPIMPAHVRVAAMNEMHTVSVFSIVADDITEKTPATVHVGRGRRAHERSIVIWRIVGGLERD